MLTLSSVNISLSVLLASLFFWGLAEGICVKCECTGEMCVEGGREESKILGYSFNYLGCSNYIPGIADISEETSATLTRNYSIAHN